MWFSRFFKKDKQKFKKLTLLECQIHGSHYYDCLKLIENNQLFVGEQLILKRQPDNEYDQYAIEVLTVEGKKLGYIPKNHSQILASLIDQKCRVSADIQSIFTTAWEPVNIRLILHFPKYSKVN